jgi:uncharacterized membrane protein YidH (DUF202 family)
MSDDAKANIDPRFDPAFQRGFDPATPVRERIPEPARRRDTPDVTQPAATQLAPSQSAPSPLAPSQLAPTRPGSPTRPPGTAPGPSAPIVVSADGDDDLPVVMTGQDAEEPDRATAAESSQTRNPFLIVLAIVAVILVAVGIWLFVQAGNEFNSRQVRSQGDYMSLDATIHMAPFIAMLGAATAIGVLFQFAARWQKRK